MSRFASPLTLCNPIPTTGMNRPSDAWFHGTESNEIVAEGNKEKLAKRPERIIEKEGKKEGENSRISNRKLTTNGRECESLLFVHR